MTTTTTTPSTRPTLTLLVDMDNTVADTYGAIEQILEKGEKEILSHFQKGKHQNFEFPIEIDQHIKTIMRKKGFFLNLKPLPGAVETLKQLANHPRLSVAIVFLTSPLTLAPYCMYEKEKWIELHFGKEWIPNLMIAKFKDLVNGDFLIDDNPNPFVFSSHYPTHALDHHYPTWKHILFSQPYNQNKKEHRGKLRLDSWKSKELEHVLLNHVKGTSARSIV